MRANFYSYTLQNICRQDKFNQFYILNCFNFAWNIRVRRGSKISNQTHTKVNLEIINFRMNQKRKRSSPRWNWFAMFSIYFRFFCFVLFHWKNIFSKKDYGTSHVVSRKKIFYSMQWKLGIRSMSKKNARLTNRSRDVMTHLHNALHPLERQVVIELHNIYIYRQ